MKKMNEAVNMNDGYPIIEFNDGYYWVRMKTPEYAKGEAEMMGVAPFSIRGDIYSLRNDKNEPLYMMAVNNNFVLATRTKPSYNVDIIARKIEELITKLKIYDLSQYDESKYAINDDELMERILKLC